jgi:site-specific DNA-methyltransferase (adenine-specific)
LEGAVLVSCSALLDDALRCSLPYPKIGLDFSGLAPANWRAKVKNRESEHEEGAREPSRGRGAEPTSTVGRGKAVTLGGEPEFTVWRDELVTLNYGDALSHYPAWDSPTAIVSDGGYGVLGFEGDTSDHLSLPEWYEPHIEAWAKASTPQTTLWFWNSEIGWAAVHPVLERHGWRYINANIWDKGKAHIAGNVNSRNIRRFPVVTEVCVQYVLEARIGGMRLREWLLREWKRSGLLLRKANEACGVADAAVRKYLDQGHLWYFPPADRFEMMAKYANEHGDPVGRPYFSRDGARMMTGEEWGLMRSKFRCPHGVTNVWSRNPLRDEERIKTETGRAVHLNQKPLDLVRRIIEASTDPGDTVWEPFGGVFSASFAARLLGRGAFAAEIDPTYYHYGVRRFIEADRQPRLL